MVDDNRDAADSLGRILEFLGVDVRLARDGAEALDVFKAYDPQVVRLDIGVPGMDGYEVARRHPRRLSRSAHFAGCADRLGPGRGPARKARVAGFDHRLAKPAEISARQKLLASL